MSDEIQVLRPRGRLDSDTSPELSRQALELIGRGGRRLLLDFRDLVYISSAGLRAVLVAAAEMTAQGGKLVIASPSPQVAEVFDISGFVSVVEMHPTAEDAAAQLMKD